MFAGTMEIIDLSSDGEAIVDLCSDGEDDSSTNMCSSDSEDDHDHHDFHNRFRQQPLHSLSTTSDDRSSDEDEPVMLDGDGFLSTHQGPSYYRTSKDFPRQPMPSMTSVIDFEADSIPKTPKKCYFNADEKAIYEEALQVCIMHV